MLWSHACKNDFYLPHSIHMVIHINLTEVNVTNKIFTVKGIKRQIQNEMNVLKLLIDLLLLET